MPLFCYCIRCLKLHPSLFTIIMWHVVIGHCDHMIPAAGRYTDYAGARSGKDVIQCPPRRIGLPLEASFYKGLGGKQLSERGNLFWHLITNLPKPSLLIIFQALIGKTLDSAHDPYIRIKEEFWPPYIEMLLRYGIASRHPEDPNKMRLEAFHQWLFYKPGQYGNCSLQLFILVLLANLPLKTGSSHFLISSSIVHL